MEGRSTLDTKGNLPTVSIKKYLIVRDLEEKEKETEKDDENACGNQCNSKIKV
jgi:hypothetical protein